MDIFRGIRYATADRRRPPVPVSYSSLEEMGTETIRLVSPQPTGTSHNIHLPEENDLQLSEDCLRLSVYVPSKEGPLPVMVWIHGGAFTSGGSQMRIYDAASLSESGGFIVVCISYRLGALGYIFSEDSECRDLGLQDQTCALRWVREHIHLFGGDPDRVTVAGQSAGAYSVQCLISRTREPLFSKAIIMSSPLILSLSESRARRTARKFSDFLGKDIMDADISEIVSAQVRTEKSSGPGMVFMPLCSTAVKDGAAPSLREVLITSQQDDGNPFSPAAWLAPLLTWAIFRAPVKNYRRSLEKHGVKTSQMLLTWRHKDGLQGATHTAELPLLFGDWALWKDIPMVRGCEEREYIQQRDALRARISEFVKG